MEQGNLIFSKRVDDVSDDVLIRCQTLKQALRLCIEVTGQPLKEIAFRLDMPDKTLSRMLADNPDDPRHFPPEAINLLMDVCENEIPLRWIALSRGYALVRLKSEVERENEQLKAEIERLQRDRDVVIGFLKEAKI